MKGVPFVSIRYTKGLPINLYNICVAKKIIWPIFTYDTIQEMLFFIRLKPREAVEK